MAYATLMEYDVDFPTHLKIADAIGDEPIPGLLMHAGGQSQRGVHVIDVWESKEASQRFFTERVVPALTTLGMNGGEPPLRFEEFNLEYVQRD